MSALDILLGRTSDAPQEERNPGELLQAILDAPGNFTSSVTYYRQLFNGKSCEDVAALAAEAKSFGLFEHVNQLFADAGFSDSIQGE